MAYFFLLGRYLDVLLAVPSKQEMADIPASSCELSLLLFDPVPGDLLTVAQLDFFRLTNTSASGDMSNCACLSRVLALYPYEPLPAILCHAPILCRYPPHCVQVVE